MNSDELDDRWIKAMLDHRAPTTPPFADLESDGSATQQHGGSLNNMTNSHRRYVAVATLVASLLAITGVGLYVARPDKTDGIDVVAASAGPEADPSSDSSPSTAHNDASTTSVTDETGDVVDPVRVGNLPEGAKEVDTLVETSPLGSKVRSTLYLLPNKTGDRDQTLRVTLMENPSAREIFESSRAAFSDQPDISITESELSGIPVLTGVTKLGADNVVSVKWLQSDTMQVEVVGYNISVEEAQSFARDVMETN